MEIAMSVTRKEGDTMKDMIEIERELDEAMEKLIALRETQRNRRA
jgi:hypothetical protein